MSNAVLVLKGPSAEHSNQVIQDLNPNIVATVNDSSLLLDVGTPISLCFFSHHVGSIRFPGREPKREYLDAIQTYVSPKRTLEFKENLWLTQENKTWFTYRHHECGGGEADLVSRIAEGGIAHHHTTTAAVHWLAKVVKVTDLHIVGLDGGDNTNYAKGLKGARTCHDGILDEFKKVTLTLLPIITRIYGVRIKVIK